MITREQALAAKVAEIKLWALENGLIESGEQISVSIAISKTPRATDLTSAQQISPEEWEGILAVAEWTKQQRASLEMLRANKNGPTELIEDYSTRRGVFNTALRKYFEHPRYQLHVPPDVAYKKLARSSKPVVLVRQS